MFNVLCFFFFNGPTPWKQRAAAERCRILRPPAAPVSRPPAARRLAPSRGGPPARGGAGAGRGAAAAEAQGELTCLMCLGLLFGFIQIFNQHFTCSPFPMDLSLPTFHTCVC